MGHARLSPSGAHRWMRCPGSVVLEASVPDEPNQYSDEGTCAHSIGALCLENGTDASAYIGRLVEVQDEGQPVRTVEFTDEMCEPVQVYVDAIRLRAKGHTLQIEQRVDFSQVVGEEAGGTSDAIILAVADKRLEVHDLKFGRGVELDAVDNEQLMLYALGAWLDNGLVADFDSVLMAIHQPRRDHYSEHEIPIIELEKFANHARAAAREVRQAVQFEEMNADMRGMLRPGEKQCRFCKAKATCPAIRDEVREAVFGKDDTASPEDFENLDLVVLPEAFAADWLSACMKKADLIEGWIKAVRAEVERRLFAGEDVDGFKVVAGRKGARAWSDATAAEEMLRKTFRLKIEDAFDLKLISPTTAEKVFKDQPKRWAKLQPLISQADGANSVAPESDKRPAIDVRPTVEDFDDLTSAPVTDDAMDLV